jgi:PAS domain S-box-containing protein
VSKAERAPGRSTDLQKIHSSLRPVADRRAVQSAIPCYRRGDMETATLQAPSGLAVAPSLRWGSHVCQLFSTGKDLRDVLVPYFKAGLENNEHCFWVTGQRFDVDQARSALRAVVPDLDAREASGQIEIQDGRAWYAAAESLQPKALIEDLLRREAHALDRGRRGVRTNGDCSWVGPSQMPDFIAYEKLVQRTVQGRRLICSCSYCLEGGAASGVADILPLHDLVVPPGESGAPTNWAPRFSTGLRFEALLEALPAAVYTTDAEGYLTYYNSAAARLWGYRPELGKQRWCGSWKIFLSDGTPVPHADCPMAVAVREGRPIHGIEADAERPDGARIPCAVYASPLFNAKGHVVGGINMLIDISGRKVAEERYATLAREMQHRVSNTLLTVQAIAGSTLRHVDSLDEFQRGFSERLHALAKTHALLTKTSHQSVAFRDVLAGELGMFADGDDARVSLAGPDVTISERHAVPVGMAIHELATNAAKYGGLSILGGRLSVSWDRAVDEITVDWVESGVEIARKPQRAGFGSRLLTEILPRQNHIQIDLDYARDGLIARLRIPTGAPA